MNSYINILSINYIYHNEYQNYRCFYLIFYDLTDILYCPIFVVNK